MKLHGITLACVGVRVSATEQD